MAIERHIVLISPEIHWNTGNIGRTCLATGAVLHLIEPLGFSLDSKQIKRAGLDYWSRVDLHVWKNFEDWFESYAPDISGGELNLLSKIGRQPIWSMPCRPRQFLVFGSETRGLPEELLKRFASLTYHIPILDKTRSLNLSTAVGIVLYESLRQIDFDHSWATL